MVDRRSKYSFLAKDRGAPSTIGETARNAQDNFVTEFFKYSEQYDIKPMPVFRIKSDTEARISNGAPRTQRLSDNDKEKIQDEESPILHLIYENKKLDIVRRVESKVSICILDALNSTMQRYNTITVLRLPDCRINAYGVMQIASMLSNIGCLRDLNLDMNPNVQENYHLLCTPQGNLSYLSLRLCEISDEGVKKIANELKFRDPPNDPKLVALSLANNHVTGKGAAHVASMLRSNRSLQSLVLTGNRICDDGASLIIKELTMITLTHIEIMDLRRRRFAELALQDYMTENGEDGENGKNEENGKSEEIGKVTEEERSRKNSKSRRRQSLTRRSKRSSHHLLQSFATSKNQESVLQDLEKSLPKHDIILRDSECHPFKTESYPINGSIVACGNFQLQHLSLSYNHLTRETVKMLINCLYYQNYMMLGDVTKGLLHVFLEGNDIIQENDDDVWPAFVQLLNIRRQDDYPNSYDFRAFVPEESQVLRKNIKILRSVESLDM